VLERIKDERVRVYVVWVPMLKTDAERAVPGAMKRLPDGRVSHYWDSKGELPEAYKSILPTKREGTHELIKAWDVYMLFPGDRKWKEKPPRPAYWMHQLPLDPKLRFDGETLATEVNKLLNAEK
jgi:hypothetical protein